MKPKRQIPGSLERYLKLLERIYFRPRLTKLLTVSSKILIQPGNEIKPPDPSDAKATHDTQSS